MMLYVSKINSADKIRLGRVYSGTASSGDYLYIDPEYEGYDEKWGKYPFVHPYTIQDLVCIVGESIVRLNVVPAGNIVGLIDTYQNFSSDHFLISDIENNNMFSDMAFRPSQ